MIAEHLTSAPAIRAHDGPTRDEIESPRPGAASYRTAHPFYWVMENNRRREFNYDRAREQTILSLMSRIETRVLHGGTQEEMDRVLRDVCGPLASQARIARQGNAKGIHAKTAWVECDNPVIACELRRFAQPLVARLAQLGITAVRFT